MLIFWGRFTVKLLTKIFCLFVLVGCSASAAPFVVVGLGGLVDLQRATLKVFNLEKQALLGFCEACAKTGLSLNKKQIVVKISRSANKWFVDPSKTLCRIHSDIFFLQQRLNFAEAVQRCFLEKSGESKSGESKFEILFSKFSDLVPLATRGLGIRDAWVEVSGSLLRSANEIDLLLKNRLPVMAEVAMTLEAQEDLMQGMRGFSGSADTPWEVDVGLLSITTQQGRMSPLEEDNSFVHHAREAVTSIFKNRRISLQPEWNWEEELKRIEE